MNINIHSNTIQTVTELELLKVLDNTTGELSLSASVGGGIIHSDTLTKFNNRVTNGLLFYTDEYIDILDPAIKNVLISHGIGNLDGVTKSAALSILSLPNWFSYNTSIYTFDELELFTNIKIIGGRAFLNASNLYSIKFPESLITIDAYAFSATNLTKITIPKNVIDIGSLGFYYCLSLKEVTLMCTTPPSIASNAFSCVYLSNIYVPNGVNPITGKTYVLEYQEAPVWSNYSSVIKSISEKPN